MKFILCITLNCGIICASGNNPCDNCEWPSSPNTTSPINHGRVFAPDPEPSPVAVKQPQSTPHYIEEPHTPAPDKTKEKVTPTPTDKQKNTAWSFVTNYKFVIPCMAVISYIAYRCLRKN